MLRFRIASLPAFTATIGLVTIGVFALGAFTIGAGEPPTSAVPTTEPIPPAKQQIFDALEGKSPAGETSDGLLDDVLGVIRQRRSILDGSSLDFSIDGDAETTGGPTSSSSMALAAEQMLKAARLLEKVGASDQDRADLVKRMRAEAVKLLSE